MKQVVPFKVLGIHFLFLFLLYLLLHYLGISPSIPSNSTLLRWDANWYNSIHQHNYFYSESSQSNSGFFPMLPLIWNILDVGPLGMSLFNAFIGFLSLALFAKVFRLEDRSFLLFLSLPSLFFIYAPYAESLFVLFSCLILYGLKFNKKALVALGLFLASTTKATSLFFIPSLAFVLLFLSPISQFKSIVFIKDFLFYSFFVLLGIAAVVALEYAQTGVCFAYFKAQSRHWSRSFNLPVFPLTTWDAYRLIYLDALGFIVGFFALLLCAKQFVQSLIQRIITIEEADKSYWFSACFLVMVLGSIVFFNPLDDATKTTSILSINRYMLVSPFMLVFLHHHLKYSRLTRLQTTSIVLLLLLTWILFNGYTSTKSTLGFLFLSTYLFSFLLLMQKKHLPFIWLLLYFVGCCFQLYFFNSFMQGLWVG